MVPEPGSRRQAGPVWNGRLACVTPFALAVFAGLSVLLLSESGQAWALPRDSVFPRPGTRSGARETTPRRAVDDRGSPLVHEFPWLGGGED